MHTTSLDYATDLVMQFMAKAKNLEMPDSPQLPSKANRNLVCDLIDEEGRETIKANAEDDFDEYIDGLTDQLVLILQGFRNCGIDPAIALREVARSNLTKYRPGYTYREDGKLLKSPHYDPPDITRIKEESAKLLKQKRSLKLYSITDGSPLSIDSLEDWWVAVWAESEDQALQWAVEHYSGERRPRGSIRDILRVPSVNEQAQHLKPMYSLPHEESSARKLREVGWRSEGEFVCEECDRCANGIEEFRVCSDCELCAECRLKLSIECEWCGDPDLEESNK